MYERCLSPTQIGGLEIKNRIARTAHATMMARDGQITDDLIAYHLARAEGGVGLTILEAGAVHRSSALALTVWDNSIIDRYKALAKAVAPSGMRVFQQLWHGGHIYMQPDGTPPWAPSTVPSPIAGIAPQPMTRRNIIDLIESYAAAARRVEAGGLDGVEIHAGHGYLLMQFLSPVLNRREDEYGGDFAGRSRLLHEVLTAVRDAVSPGFPVGVRLSNSADSRVLSMDDVGRVAASLRDAGLIDYVNMSYGDYYALQMQVAGMDMPAGFQIPHAAPPVEGFGLPRLLNGRFRTLEEVEQVLRADEADIVSMVRAHIADPDIVAKTTAGRPEQVRPCLACNQGCIGRVATGGRLGCVVNTSAGAEAALSEKLIRPVSAPAKVFIAGGGPGGMEAARIAALSGHRVTLAEAAADLGGLLNLYRAAPRMGTIPDIADWLEQEVYRLGVDVRLSSYMEADEIVAEGADHVILAIGGALESPVQLIQYPADEVAIASDANVVSSIELFADRSAAQGETALVVDEVGHYEAIACAELLIERGFKVTFVTRHKMFAPHIDIALRTQSALERLYAKGKLTVHVSSRLRQVRAGEAEIGPNFSSTIERVAADTVVWVGARAGQPALAEELRARGVEPICVGDMLGARNIQTAIREGHFATRRLEGASQQRDAA